MWQEIHLDFNWWTQATKHFVFYMGPILYIVNIVKHYLCDKKST